METNISLPLNVAKRQTVAEVVIIELSKEWPLNLTSIHQKIIREIERAVSMQATHKALKKLVRENVLSKTGKAYSLNPIWLEQVSNFGEQTKQAYVLGKNNNFLVKKDSTTDI